MDSYIIFPLSSIIITEYSGGFVRERGLPLTISIPIIFLT